MVMWFSISAILQGRRNERRLNSSWCNRFCELHRHAQEYPVEFFVENMSNREYFLLKTPDELPLIGTTSFALDIGHAPQNRCLGAFLSMPTRHYHLHDNDGSDDTHAAIGERTIDFHAVMKALRKTNILPVIEVTDLSDVLKSIDCLKELRCCSTAMCGAGWKKLQKNANKSKNTPQCFIGITHNLVRQPVTVDKHPVLSP